MSESRPIPVIVNSGARAGRDLDADAVRRAFAKHGLDADVQRVEGSAIDSTVKRALDAGASIVVAAGGDGTVNAVATHLLDRKDAVLGVLPVGTLNHFSKDLKVPPELEDAVAVIAAGHVREVDVGDVNGRPFLNNSSLGLYARLVVERERLQQHRHLGKWPAMFRAGWSVLRHPRTFSAVLHVDGRELCRRTPFVFVGNNDYIIEGTRAGERTTLDDGELAVYVLRPCGPWGLILLALRALSGRIVHGRDLDRLRATSFVVESHHGQARVARDGEVDVLDAPVHYRVRPRALRVLAPPPQEAG
ncbi:diacylglycerol/lipid kinase family protein [Cognatilysobacter terrigena]|uniref:diacylglycerol/lipid kinase family protein n=1 Tax=Cognatilysobacter terrigena TaxID=2488749 RepID=UPI00105D5695|nr:diacylglycerol kinase family protein [Lysobacter terrigena]